MAIFILDKRRKPSERRKKEMMQILPQNGKDYQNKGNIVK